jgi:hypothetical protein
MEKQNFPNYDTSDLLFRQVYKSFEAGVRGLKFHPLKNYRIQNKKERMKRPFLH